MSAQNRRLPNSNKLDEGLPTWDDPASEVQGFISRAKATGRGKAKAEVPRLTKAGKLSKKTELVPHGGETHKARKEMQRASLLRRAVTRGIPRRVGSIPSEYQGSMTVAGPPRKTVSSRVMDLLKRKGIDPQKASSANILKAMRTARGGTGKRSTDPKVKATPEHERRVELKSFAVQSKKGRSKAGHGGGASGKGGAAQKSYGDAYQTPSMGYIPPRERREESMSGYVARTITASPLAEALLTERRNENRKDHKTRRQRFRDKRSAGSLKGHKEKTEDGKKKYENPTTFKKCPQGAMVGTPHLRHQIPKNRFAKPDADNPTFPIRSNCRASLAGVARALQFTKANQKTARQVISRVNRLGGVRGKSRIRLWGTGTSAGGSRMETHRGPSGSPKRNKSYGTPTGERDDRLHTASHEHGKAGNREVARATGHAAKPPLRAMSKRKQKRREAGEKVTIARGKKKVDAEQRGPIRIPKSPKMRGEGAALAAKFARRAGKRKKKGR